MLKFLCAGCLGLFLAISAQFTLKLCVVDRNWDKITKTAYFGGSRSFKVIDVNTFMKFVTCACLFLSVIVFTSY